MIHFLLWLPYIYAVLAHALAGFGQTGNRQPGHGPLFNWVDGSPVDVELWQPGGPFAAPRSTAQLCVGLGNMGLLAAPCSYQQPFTCAVPLSGGAALVNGSSAAAQPVLLPFHQAEAVCQGVGGHLVNTQQVSGPLLSGARVVGAS